MRIAVAMSGGVDSSYAALSLKERGHDVIGLTARWGQRRGPDYAARLGSPHTPGAPDLVERAAQAARDLGLSHHVIDLSREFEERVVAETVRAYASGLTPNPCALCNSLVRFPFLAASAREFGAEALATGHYARLLPREGGGGRLPVRLCRGRDPEHEQSYFLFAVHPETLAFARFPLGDMTKSEVRELMAREGHPSAGTRSSQDLCFAGGRDLAGLLRSRLAGKLTPGRVVHLDGRILGEHDGLARYTIGQRKGVGVAWTQALYVIELRPETNELVVGPDEALMRTRFSVEDVRWLGPDVTRRNAERFDCGVQVRYRMKAVPARVTPESGGRAHVELARPVRATAPGQAAVFYAETPEGDEVLGGGWIARG